MASEDSLRRERPPLPILPPPPAPPGQGERLASCAATRGAFWRLVAKTLLFMIVIWTIPTVVAVEQAPDHPWRATAIGAGSVMLVTWLLMLYMGPPRAVSAGEGWLAIRNWRRVHWVRTDRLAKVKVIPPRVLILKDRDGRKVKMHLRELRWNAKVFDLFTRGLRHSVETGMKPMNKTTLRFLPLK